jgi:hypothetical protein
MVFKDLEKLVINDRWIEDFRKEHISRAFEVRLKGGLIKPRHPHRNHPYCNICDKDYEEWDVGYRLYVGGRPVVYHSECIEASWDTKKVKNVVAQDRGFRRNRNKGKHEANELKVRAQLYKFIIGSVLNDASSEDPWPQREIRPNLQSNVQPLTPISELDIRVSGFGADDGESSE